MNNIICKICGQNFFKSNHISHHLKSTHKIDYNEYIKENFDDFKDFGWKKCIECGSPFKEGRSDKCGKCYTKNHQIKEDQFIICRICNEPEHSKTISQHLKIYHNVLFRDYVKEYLEDFRKFGWCHCIVCGEICRNKSKSHNQPTCSTICSSELRKTWIGKESTRFGAVLSDITKDKISEKNKEFYSITDNHPFYGKHHTEETKKKISKSHIGLLLGEKNGMYGKTHTPEAIKKIFSHRPMNKLEKLVADELDKAHVSYIFQYFINEDGVCKSYDFKIKEKPLILEVDGDFWHGNPEKVNHHNKVEKTRQNDILKEEIALKRGIKVIRLWESDIKKDPSIVIRTLSSYIY
jgi:hypothetical protein